MVAETDAGAVANNHILISRHIGRNSGLHTGFRKLITLAFYVLICDWMSSWHGVGLLGLILPEGLTEERKSKQARLWIIIKSEDPLAPPIPDMRYFYVYL